VYNYARLAVGPHWEALEDKHPHRKLSKRIEDELRQLVERQERLEQVVKRAE